MSAVLSNKVITSAHWIPTMRRKLSDTLDWSSRLIFPTTLWVNTFIIRLKGARSSSDGKESACNAEDMGLIPGSGRSPGEGNGNPPQYFYLENSMDRGALWATVHRVSKSQTQLSDFVTPWIVAHLPLSREFSRRECWGGLPFPSPGDLPDPGLEPGSPALQEDSLLSEPPGKPQTITILYYNNVMNYR